MPIINKASQRFFMYRLYAGMLKTIVLKHRNDDQGEGVMTSYTLYGCILPGNKVEGRISGASKSFYSGEAVEEICSSGTVFSTTINHPILTPTGFIPAGKLKPGDDLVCDIGENKISSKNIQNSPISIEEIFKTFLKVSSTGMGSTFSHTPIPLDFHGDGQFVKGNIDIVRPNWKLLSNWEFENPETSSDIIFHRTYPSFSQSIHTLSKFFLPSLWMGIRKISISDLICSLFWGHSCPLGNLCFASSSEFNSSIFQNASNIKIEDSLETYDRFTREISGDNFFPMRKFLSYFNPPQFLRFGIGSRFNSSLFETVDKTLMIKTGDRGLFSNLSDRFPRQVKIDKIINVRRFHYEGPVYDLETPTGYYLLSSNGPKVFVSNCRRSKTHKGGEPLAGDMASRQYTTWHIPREELDRVGISYINAGDQIVETSISPTETRLWQIESTSNLRDQLLRDHLCLDCLLINTANKLGSFGSQPTEGTAYVD